MTDTLPGAADLTAALLIDEVVKMAPGRLQEAVRAGAWPVHPMRAELEAPERLAAARRLVADLHRAHADEVWRQLGARGWRSAPARITALQTEALAQAWARLGGGSELLFHLRRPEHLLADLRVSRARLAAPRIAIDPNPGVPVAPYLDHPISIDEAARFSILLPLLRRCTELGEAATRALDAIGQPTTALQARAEQQREPPRRRPVWRRPNAVRVDRSGIRMVTLTAVQVLLDVDDRAALDRGSPHPSEWNRLAALTHGALAWRLACERDVRVGRRISQSSHTVHLRPAIVGRRYHELDDPFAPLLAIVRLGCCLYAYAAGTMTFELRP